MGSLLCCWQLQTLSSMAPTATSKGQVSAWTVAIGAQRPFGRCGPEPEPQIGECLVFDGEQYRAPLRFYDRTLTGCHRPGKRSSSK